MPPTLVTVVLVVVTLALVRRGLGWREVEQDGDLPWLGSGRRARRFRKQKAAFMTTTGTRTLDRWGPSRWRGEDPYSTAFGAIGFLNRRGVLQTWPESKTSGTVGTGSEAIRARVAPYRFFVVCLRPTIVVMSFDLGAVAGVVPEPEHFLMNYRVDNLIEYGTRLPSAGSLLWFGPGADVLPTPVALEGDSRGVIACGSTRLHLEREPEGWRVEMART